MDHIRYCIQNEKNNNEEFHYIRLILELILNEENIINFILDDEPEFKFDVTNYLDDIDNLEKIKFDDLLDIVTIELIQRKRILLNEENDEEEDKEEKLLIKKFNTFKH